MRRGRHDWIVAGGGGRSTSSTCGRRWKQVSPGRGRASSTGWPSSRREGWSDPTTAAGPKRFTREVADVTPWGSARDLAHCRTPSTPRREYRGSRETLASSDSSDAEVRGMRSPDCPPFRRCAGRTSALPFRRNRSTARRNGQAKNRWQEPLVPRQDGAGRSTQRRAMPRWFGGKRPFRFPRVAKEALAGYSARNGGLHVKRCPVGGSWTITALAARIRTA